MKPVHADGKGTSVSGVSFPSNSTSRTFFRVDHMQSHLQGVCAPHLCSQVPRTAQRLPAATPSLGTTALPTFTECSLLTKGSPEQADTEVGAFLF